MSDPTPPFLGSFRFVCRKCGAQREHGGLALYPGMVTPYPEIPPKWKSINGVTFCEKHEVLVMVDGAPEIVA